MVMRSGTGAGRVELSEANERGSQIDGVRREQDEEGRIFEHCEKSD